MGSFEIPRSSWGTLAIVGRSQELPATAQGYGLLSALKWPYVPPRVAREILTGIKGTLGATTEANMSHEKLGEG